MYPEPFAMLTSTAMLRAIKVLLKHDTPPAAILAFIEDYEAQEEEAKKVVSELPAIPRHLYQNA